MCSGRGSNVTIDLGSGPGFIVGGGYDIRLGRVALTPALNYWRGHIGAIEGRGVSVESSFHSGPRLFYPPAEFVSLPRVL